MSRLKQASFPGREMSIEGESDRLSLRHLLGAGPPRLSALLAAFAIARLESREQTGIRDQRSLMLTAMVTLALIALVLLGANVRSLRKLRWLSL